MALNQSIGKQEIITKCDLRVCNFYADWLQKNQKINTAGMPRQDVEYFRKTLNRLIDKNFPDKEQQVRLLSEMESACNKNILPMGEFDWLKQDERATFWLWAYLYNIRDKIMGFPLSVENVYEQTLYAYLGLHLSPSGHLDRVNNIIIFFDRVYFSEVPGMSSKKLVMETLKDKWSGIYNKPLPLKWLPDEEEAVLWAWNNLKSVQGERNNNYSRAPGAFVPAVTTWFKPLSHAERHLALRAALDLWEDEPDSKKLFLLNLNKAWNQQKLRKSRIDKKPLNTYLKNETKMRLDLMAEQSGLRISDMLEKLINEHYRNTIGSK